MEEIVLESVRLIAADQVSELVISQLRSEHIYSLENSSYVLMNMVLVSSKNGIQNIKNVLANHKKAKRAIAVLIDSELQVPEMADIDSVLSFTNKDEFYNEFKSFLSLIRHNVEIHGLVSFDFNDFFTMIKGRNELSVHSCAYNEKISEATSELRKNINPNHANYLLTFTVEHYNPDTFGEELYPIKTYIDELPDEGNVFWNFRESSTKEVVLFISKQILS